MSGFLPEWHLNDSLYLFFVFFCIITRSYIDLNPHANITLQGSLIAEPFQFWNLAQAELQLRFQAGLGIALPISFLLVATKARLRAREEDEEEVQEVNARLAAAKD